ncbi:PfkB family carbohydrate kinase [Pseudoclavibacter sp. RFBA6]|uniref:PfkB family carbohydrate kinase n=1 Tax=Pseudoclavibacter sp. RFBA6 TaxID=2080573 RepID=UPI000CE745FE|nr:PfkB family carbohydrate kinase [Pseudoclavibacter sp. RFBA6]PPG42149.1 hypothetical protein C5C17_04100 [Pseudoclavibacter sp. RFBA6]
MSNGTPGIPARTAQPVSPARVAVFGQAGRDLVLRVAGIPDAGASAVVSERIERLGGKGASIAVGIRQLDPTARVSLIAVLGEDGDGTEMLREAASHGLDTRHVVRRGATALLTDVVADGGVRRLLEHIPQQALLTPDDVRAATALTTADAVVLQLQQPFDTLLAAAQLTRQRPANGVPRALLVLDGAVDATEDRARRDELVGFADVVRANAREASMLSGSEVRNREDALRTASTLLDLGPRVVALTVDDAELIAWPGEHVFLPHERTRTVDPTGAGDAFVATLTTALLSGASPREAGQRATQAAGASVQRLGGHPKLRRLPPDRKGSMLPPSDLPSTDGETLA